MADRQSWYVMRYGTSKYRTAFLTDTGAITARNDRWVLGARPFDSKEMADDYRARWEAAGGEPPWR
jgi:hypothetical protein